MGARNTASHFHEETASRGELNKASTGSGSGSAAKRDQTHHAHGQTAGSGTAVVTVNLAPSTEDSFDLNAGAWLPSPALEPVR